MKVLIIGGTRFIGPFVIRELVAKDHQVAVYHRGGNEPELPASVIHFHSTRAKFPVLEFEPDVLDYCPEVVLHMTPMGEADAQAVVTAFTGIAQRMVAISSGDVYRAYERFMGVPGPIEGTPLTEDAPLREHLYPYRKHATSPDALEYSYDKILVERAVMGSDALKGTILRLPKVYGPGDNSDLATVYRFQNHPEWCWTHGYVEDVAHAIALAVTRDCAAGQIYNVGEEPTPSVEERLKSLPRSEAPLDVRPLNFAQDMIYDTTKVRRELGYREVVEYEEGIRRTIASLNG